LCGRPFCGPRADGPDARPAPDDAREDRAAAPGGVLTLGSQPASLGDALAWLDRHVNLEAIQSGHAGLAAYPTLDRIRLLLHVLGDPQLNYPIVHITGTNGKGSTARMASALLVAKGLSVGTYGSPHLERINERIAWDGVPISDADLATTLSTLAGLETLLPQVAKDPRLRPEFGDDFDAVRPTWFELMTGVAYSWFSDVAVEVAVVEVGLGGRFDATNAGDGTVAVITNVELDHVDLLGSRRVDIAEEKAGIIKAGADVVLGETDPELVAIFEAEAERVGAARLWIRDQEFGCTSNALAAGGRVVDLYTPFGSYEDVYIPVHGPHQGNNAACALAAAEAFFGERLDDDVVAEAFSGLTLPGRMEVISRQPLVLIDGAHNAAGARAAGDTLAEDFEGLGQVVVVMGCLSGREPIELLEGLGPDRIRVVIASPAPSPRGLPPTEISAAAARLGLPSETAASVPDAIDRAFDLAGEDEMILVTGSLYVVGLARTVLRRRAA
jgi:dihydrofolate synthase/folylpolyglutamate synthase